MGVFPRFAVLMGAVLLSLFPALARADSPSPCLGAHVRCRAGERFLEATYELDLRNPTDAPADVVLLSSVDTLERVEGVRGKLVINRAGDALRASVPPGWAGRITVHVRQRIVRLAGRTAFTARLPMPPAVRRTVEVDLPGPRAELSAGPNAVVLPQGDAEGRSHCRVVPFGTGTLELEWTQRPPARAGSYSFAQTHDLSEDPPEFRDVVTLEFTFDGAPPESVSVQLPPGIHLQAVEPDAGVRWRLLGDILRADLPEGFTGDQITLTCRVTGTTQDLSEGAHSLRVPIFRSPDAQRTEGRVLVSGGRHELTFERLDGAVQTAAEGDSHKLSCVFHGADPVIAVRIVPIRATARATVETHYAISAHRIAGTHHVTVDYGEAAPPTLLLLPEGHVVRDVWAARGGPDWAQEGRRLRIEPPELGASEVTFAVATEALTDQQRKFDLAPPSVLDLDATDYRLAVSADGVQMTTGGPAERWRVAADRLPHWLQAHKPGAAYVFRDRPLAVAVEVYPIQPELAGSVQDHATVQEDRVLREALFTLEVHKRPVSDLCVLLPEGLTAERVDGALIESWEQPGDGRELQVRFRGPVIGPLHFRLVATEPAEPGPVRLQGIALRDAPHLKGWFAVSGDVSMNVRPMEDGQTNLRSMRIEQAPDYLKAFDNKLLYELYDSRWWLDLQTELVPPVYVAQVLDVLRFRAAQAEATAFVHVVVERGGVGELVFELPAGVVSPRFEGPDVVLSQGEGGTWRVRFRGRRTGTFDCRLHYDVVSGMGPAAVNVAPVRLRGAREQEGLLLLLQERPDVEVAPGPPPAALAATDAQDNYWLWSYRREFPALAAYTYRGVDWSLPVEVRTQALSDLMLSARITHAELDTLVQDNGETLNHLYLRVPNTTRQFLTLDLDALGEGARLIGTYAFGKPVKPFREGERRLQIPLFTDERAAQLGRSQIDVTYTTPQNALKSFARQDMAAPDLGLNVEKFDWTVRVPNGCRLAAVGGNMGKPVGPSPAPSLAGRLLKRAWLLLRHHGGWMVLLGVIAAACAAGYGVVRLVTRHGGALRKLVPASPLLTIFIVLGVACILAATLMPGLAKARKSARLATQSSDLHNLGLGINMYLQDTGGEYPPDIDAVFDAGYLEDESMLRWAEQEVVYRKPSPNPSGEEAVAYFWPPQNGKGANVLYADYSVEWSPLNEHGELRNKRTGELLATWRPEREPSASLAYVPSSFGRTDVRTGELMEAVQAEQQAAPAAGQALYAARARRRQEALDEIVLDANRDKLEAALERYRADNDGESPNSAGELTPYLSDRQLGEVLNRRDLPASAETARETTHFADESTTLETKKMAADRYNLAMAQVEGGDYVAAEKNLEYALKFDEGHKQAQSQLRQVKAMKRIAGEATEIAGSERQLLADISQMDVEQTKGKRELEQVARQLERQEEAAMRGRLGVSLGLPASEQTLPRRGAQQVDTVGIGPGGEVDRMAPTGWVQAEAAARQADQPLTEQKRREYARAAREVMILVNDGRLDEARLQVEDILRADPDDKLAAILMAEVSAVEHAVAADMMKVQATNRAGARTSEAVAADMIAPPERPLTYPDKKFWKDVVEANEPAAGPAPTDADLRFRKGALVRQLGGGRSTGALPITIDFPLPRSTTEYRFMKPFLGRVSAKLQFRPIGRGAALATELILAVVAFAAFLVLRARRTGLAVPFAALAFLAAMAAVLAAPPAAGGLFAGTALAMALCLIGEALRTVPALILRPRSQHDAS